MKRPRIWVAALVVVAAAAAWMFHARGSATDEPSVATAAVTRGDVVETVDATGTLQAVTTVQVGTQVSGTIKALHADFNSRVRRGQVIAELEPSLFQTQVEQARASLTKLEADVQRAQVELDDARQKLTRAKELAAQQLISASDLDTAEVNARVADAALGGAQAQVTQGRASLHQAEVNLDHTIITSPIDGVVVSRNVDVGQTVAASTQAPTLFVIARDLSDMRVEASIAESDIGSIRTGQRATFRVDAYPGDIFTGAVSQVRLQPVVEQNVVSYVTVIAVANPDLRLKPGMTANVTVEVARATDVLRVPNSALRVKPSAEVLAAFLHHPGGIDVASTAGTRIPTPTAIDHRDDHARGEIWVLANGRLAREPVDVGINDGTRTAVYGDALSEGALVVTGISGEVPATPASTSPLIPSFRGRGAGRGGGGASPTTR